jgi:osmoprotectant transport system ATP-binding protein
MLMDEPFGAIDPITRANLQNEFLRILRRLKKTVIFVTHDIDEAIKMGDRIAILKDGRLVQYGTPDEILSRPADAFVAEFVGADRALKRLNLVSVRDVMQAGAGGGAVSVPPDTSLKDALALMLVHNARELAVVENGTSLGSISMNAIQQHITGVAG